MIQFEIVENNINESISILTEKIRVLNEIKLLINSNILRGENSNINQPKYLNIGKKNTVDFNPALYVGYPVDGKFPEKMKFIDNIHQQAWRLPERRELIIKIEGIERANRTLESITGKLQNLRKSGQYLVAKYGSINKYSFYLRPEWRTDDGLDIREHYAPPNEILNGLPIEKRDPAKIDWLSN